jgi:hypothetical protein
MNRLIKYKRGAVLLHLCIGIVAVMTTAISSLQAIVSTHPRFGLHKQLSTEVKINEVLNMYHDSLLAYSTVQGFSNPTEFGRLPCPDRNNDGSPDSPCNTFNLHIGTLPIRSKITTPTFHEGLPAIAQSPINYATHQTLQYAVAPYVNNGEDVVWSTTPPAAQLLTVVSSSGRLLDNSVIAVIGQNIRKGRINNEVIIAGQYRTLSLAEWQAALFLKSRSAMATTVRQLMMQRHTNLLSNASINTAQLSLSNAVYTAASSACNCSCTKTRCTCSCNSSSHWQSANSCNALSTGTCSGDTLNGYTCNAKAGQTCVFNGPVSMQSAWPVTQYSPKLLQGNTCKPSNNSMCPLSVNNAACVCKYDWPLALQGNRLQQLSLAISESKLAITDKQLAGQLSALISTSEQIQRRQFLPYVDQSRVATVSKTP